MCTTFLSTFLPTFFSRFVNVIYSHIIQQPNDGSVLEENPHITDQGDMKIVKQDTQSVLFMFWINKALCYRQLFLPIHALTATIFSFWFEECLLLAEIADSKRLCAVLSVFEIFEEIP